MILDHIDNCQMYYGVHKDFEKAFGFIQDFLKHPLENGKYEIDGENVFATVSDCELHETGNMEAHNKYIDIQFLVKGREIIKVINRNCLEIKEDLTPGKDVIFYKENDLSSAIQYSENSFMIFFPQDGHEPCIINGDCKTAKKIVVKVKI